MNGEGSSSSGRSAGHRVGTGWRAAAADGGTVYADGWRRQLPGDWPARPDEFHEHHRMGFWTRDRAQLVLSCCGLEGT